MAELAEIGFDTFEENQNGFHAYIEEAQMDFEATKSLLEQYAGLSPIHYGMQKIARENWNQTWESNYPPIVIGNQILVKTPFHQIEEDFKVVLTIIPKMSFGTGHHATTSQMLSMLLAHPPEKARVVDAGTGTGILAIMAEKLGAEDILGFDNDLYRLRDFGSTPALKTRATLERIRTGGSTNDYAAIRLAHQMLLRHHATRRVAFVLGDGVGDRANASRQVRQGENLGISTIGIGIGYDVRSVYGAGSVRVDRPADLGRVAFQKMKGAA